MDVRIVMDVVVVRKLKHGAGFLASRASHLLISLLNKRVVVGGKDGGPRHIRDRLMRFRWSASLQRIANENLELRSRGVVTDQVCGAPGIETSKILFYPIKIFGTK